MDKKLIDALLATITMYQQAYNSFTKANPKLKHEQIKEMTDSWWHGVMTMTGLANQKKGGEFEL